VLTSILPKQYKTAGIVSVPKVPTSATEATYVGLYSFIISIIYLSGGRLSEDKLERYLRRANADASTGIGQTEKLKDRMVREGYIVRIRDSSTGDEVVDYIVGPRGKTEVGVEGSAGLVRAVYGENVTEDLERRLDRTLGLSKVNEAAQSAQAKHIEAPKRRGKAYRQAGHDDSNDD
jgi:melanoma-associated antigen